MEEEAQRALQSILTQHGRQLLDHPDRCERLMREHCPAAKVQVSVLVDALKNKVPQRLLASGGTVASQAIDALAATLANERALAIDAARWSVEAWAGALGLVVQPGVKREIAKPDVRGKQQAVQRGLFQGAGKVFVNVSGGLLLLVTAGLVLGVIIGLASDGWQSFNAYIVARFGSTGKWILGAVVWVVVVSIGSLFQSSSKK